MKQDDKQTPETEALADEAKARRDFLRKAGAAGIAAPAVAILLSAEVKAQTRPSYGPPTRPTPPPPPTRTIKPTPPPTPPRTTKPWPTTTRPPD